MAADSANEIAALNVSSSTLANGRSDTTEIGTICILVKLAKFHSAARSRFAPPVQKKSAAHCVKNPKSNPTRARRAFLVRLPLLNGREHAGRTYGGRRAAKTAKRIGADVVEAHGCEGKGASTASQHAPAGHTWQERRRGMSLGSRRSRTTEVSPTLPPPFYPITAAWRVSLAVDGGLSWRVVRCVRSSGEPSLSLSRPSSFVSALGTVVRNSRARTYRWRLHCDPAASVR